MSSEKTAAAAAAAAGTIGEVRFGPFAMLPFMGYNAGDYMQHWLDIGQATDAEKLPKLYWVGFRKGDDGSFLWPGYGENSRVLKWVIERAHGKAVAIDTAIGRVPAINALDTDGLDIDPRTEPRSFVLVGGLNVTTKYPASPVAREFESSRAVRLQATRRARTIGGAVAGP